MGKVAQILNRLYADYLMPSRADEYKEILNTALEAKYTFITVLEFAKLVRSSQLDPELKYFINRHDIDTGLDFTKEFFRIEQEFGIKSTYYFRLKTLDLKLMRSIDSYGSEVAYHFEEVASYAKWNKIKTKEDVLLKLPEIKKEFIANFEMISSASGIKIETVASHGDFVNRLLGLTNSIIIDEDIRRDLGIYAETYDSDLLKACNVYISDDDYPRHFKPQHPVKAIGQGPRVIQMLSHPRHWKRDLISNTSENFSRIIEGIKYGS